MRKPLTIKAVTALRWKGGITNEKKYFSGNRVEKVLTTVKTPFDWADTSLESINPYAFVPHLESILVEYSKGRVLQCLIEYHCLFPPALPSSPA